MTKVICQQSLRALISWVLGYYKFKNAKILPRTFFAFFFALWIYKLLWDTNFWFSKYHTQRSFNLLLRSQSTNYLVHVSRPPQYLGLKNARFLGWKNSWLGCINFFTQAFIPVHFPLINFFLWYSQCFIHTRYYKLKFSGLSHLIYCNYLASS